ncbi:MAG: lipoyl domain-containing protein [Deltaproteobacteria bacterium]|jgi:pyruvate/2-oxoglutarate dehydrogenase complex dihydrolipoamide acyltransferase (E2) component|nr:lipoyl domain-containing protein [Deltaproteobacteria bacterium]MBW2386013.1 lipoyl domain-containing protein [Deltaproteobacteria bacterium]MBW2695436.1 lipoyl domain-containing protein [Deltaproteobacteria bacterium]
MSIEVHVPQWGMGIKECKVVSWLKSEGDAVEEGEPIVELETAKATQELEAPATGTLTRILAPEGETVAVRTVIAEIGEVQA